jgi:hypothetical protein
MGCDVGTQLFIEAETARASTSCESGRYKSTYVGRGSRNPRSIRDTGYIKPKLRVVWGSQSDTYQKEGWEKMKLVITISDVLTAKGCARGALRFCRKHGLDEKKLFIGGGLPVEDLCHIDDAMLKTIIEVARGQR